MISMMTRNLVETALTSRPSKDAFAQRMGRLADDRYVALSKDDLVALTALGARYVRETLRLLEACATAGSQARADHVVAPMVQAGERLFLGPSAAAPPADTLFGALCRSYLIRCSVAALSEQTRRVRGFPLLSTDPHSEAPMIRRLIGADLAARLDAEAEEVVQDPALQAAARGAFCLAGSLNATGRVNEWGARWEEEMSRLGAAAQLARP